MKHISAATQYQNTDQMEVTKSDDNSILIKCFDELIKSMKIFQTQYCTQCRKF